MWPRERYGCVADPLEVLDCAANTPREAEGCRSWCRSHTRQPFRRDIGSLHKLKVDGDISRVGSKDRGGTFGDTEFREKSPLMSRGTRKSRRAPPRKKNNSAKKLTASAESVSSTSSSAHPPSTTAVDRIGVSVPVQGDIQHSIRRIILLTLRREDETFVAVLVRA